MSRVALLTPSYRPDLISLLELHETVRNYTDGDVVHHVVVPDKDVPLFARHAGERLRVHSIRSFMPASFLSTYVTSERLRRSARLAKLTKIQAVNLRRPWPPVRGWILQQVAKLAVAGQLEADVVLVIDSDVALIKRVSASDFVRDGVVRFFKSPDGVKADMPEHLAWYRTAHRLLGLPVPFQPPLPDYISPFLAWDPAVVKQVQERIVEVTGQDWRSAICGELVFSECILYGCFVDTLGAERHRQFTQPNSRCLTYWENSPLISSTDVDLFLTRLRGDELVLNIQSVSGTDVAVRRAAASRATELLETVR